MTAPPIDSTERPLSEDEKRDLSARLDRARADSRTALMKVGAVGAAVCGVLAVLTLAASDAPASVVLAFWTVLAALLTLWIGLPQRKLVRGQIPVLEEALRTNRAREIRLRSSRVVEFEEEEDEGACYAFEAGPGSVIFVVGQEFYDDVDFPNDDFSMIEILGTNGRAMDVLCVKHGKKLQPERIVPAAVKNGLQLPEHLQVVAAPLDRIESALSA